MVIKYRRKFTRKNIQDFLRHCSILHSIHLIPKARISSCFSFQKKSINLKYCRTILCFRNQFNKNRSCYENKEMNVVLCKLRVSRAVQLFSIHTCILMRFKNLAEGVAGRNFEQLLHVHVCYIRFNQNLQKESRCFFILNKRC